MTTTPSATMSSAPAPETTCSLEIGGMTCASCVRRVEKALSRVDGVAEARVNLATEAATVGYDPARVTPEQLTAAVAAAGYTGTLRSGDTRPHAPTQPDPEAPPPDARDIELAGLKRRWQVALTAGLGLMVLMYVPLPIDAMDWLMPALLVVATVVQFWAGHDIYQAALAAARHRATNMNTLVALGTTVAYAYSAFVTLWPAAAERWGLPLHVYYETSLVIIALVLLGRWLEARAKKQTTAAVTALVGSCAEDGPGAARQRRGRRCPRPARGRGPGASPAR
jgi:Cu+-exporting ATPase